MISNLPPKAEREHNNMTEPQDPFDLSLLIKLLGMTGSTSDGEALSAIRKANSVMLKNNCSWEALLRGKVKIIADPFANINIPQHAPTPPPPSNPPPKPPDPGFANPQNYQYYGGTRKYPPPPPPPQPKPADPLSMGAAKPFATNPNPAVTNKFEGTCIYCTQQVPAGAGQVQRINSKWQTWHYPTCPPKKPRQRKAFTADDLQV